MHSGERWRLGHRPALDGLRGIAVLLVLVTHFDLGQFDQAGAMGVSIFFTLSGFLITSLLLAERSRAGRISLPGFYRRRALRLLPALGAVLVAVACLAAVGISTGVAPVGYAAVAGYVWNWYLLAQSHGGVAPWSALGHAWSLAIEEQFYLVWPLVVMACVRRGRRAVLTVALGGAALSLAWGAYSGRPTFSSEISAYDLLIGCALAAWLHGGRARMVSSAWALPLVVAVAVLAPAGDVTLSHLLTPPLTALAIFALVNSGARGFTSRPLLWVGRRSYGLYLWHYPVAYLAFHTTASWAAIASVGVSVSFALTALSWRFIEEPFLRLKSGHAGHAADEFERRDGLSAGAVAG